MKLALTVLPLAALLSATSAQAVLATYNSTGSKEYYVASNDDITSSIEALSRTTKQKEDSLASLANRFSNTVTINNSSLNRYGSTAGNMLAIRPISSSMPVTSGYRYRSIFGRTQFHKGVDFGAPIGTPVYATGNGVVTYSGWGTGYGRYIEVDHGNGLVTRYSHMSANYVNVGDSVSANQQIGASGNTGRSTGPHLHYEVRQNGQAVNPQTYLAMAPAR